MSRIRKVLGNNHDVICLNLAVVAIMGLIGAIGYDVILALASTGGSGEDLSVAPVGAWCAYIGILLNVLFFALLQGYSTFRLQMSMGQTRKGFFLEQCAVRGGLLLAEQLMCYGMYRFDLWKIAAFYPEHEVSHLTEGIRLLFQPAAVLLITLFGLAISLLLIALALRFGVKANFAMLVLYLLFVFLINRTEAVAEYWNAHFVGADFVKAAFAALAAASVVCLAAAWGLLRRQEVK